MTGNQREAAPFRPQYVVLADQVSPTAKNGLDILGAFDMLRVATLPTRLTFFATTRLIGETDGALGKHRLKHRFVWPSGEEREGQTYADAEFVSTPFGVATERLTIRLHAVPIFHYGLHRVVIMVDGKDVGDAPLLILPPRTGE